MPVVAIRLPTFNRLPHTFTHPTHSPHAGCAHIAHTFPVPLPGDTPHTYTHHTHGAPHTRGSFGLHTPHSSRFTFAPHARWTLYPCVCGWIVRPGSVPRTRTFATFTRSVTGWFGWLDTHTPGPHTFPSYILPHYTAVLGLRFQLPHGWFTHVHIPLHTLRCYGLTLLVYVGYTHPAHFVTHVYHTVGFGLLPHTVRSRCCIYPLPDTPPHVAVVALLVTHGYGCATHDSPHTHTHKFIFGCTLVTVHTLGCCTPHLCTHGYIYVVTPHYLVPTHIHIHTHTLHTFVYILLPLQFTVTFTFYTVTGWLYICLRLHLFTFYFCHTHTHVYMDTQFGLHSSPYTVWFILPIVHPVPVLTWTPDVTHTRVTVWTRFVSHTTRFVWLRLDHLQTYSIGLHTHRHVCTFAHTGCRFVHFTHYPTVTFTLVTRLPMSLSLYVC